MADLNLGLVLGSLDPNFAATVISFESFEKILERCLSARPFLCLIPAQCECPAIYHFLFSKFAPITIGSTLFAKPVSLLATTNNPAKVLAMQNSKVNVTGRVSVETDTKPESISYMRAKVDKMGHMLSKHIEYQRSEYIGSHYLL